VQLDAGRRRSAAAPIWPGLGKWDVPDDMRIALEEARQELEAAVRKAMRETLEAGEIEQAQNFEKLVTMLAGSLGEDRRKPKKMKAKR
jgi:hypothetical protein